MTVDVLRGLEEDDDITLLVRRELLVVGNNLEAILNHVLMAIGGIARSVRDATSLQSQLGVLGAVSDGLAVCLSFQFSNSLFSIEFAI